MDESLLARNFVRDADRPHHGVRPYSARAFQIDFDFVAHEIKIQCDDGRAAGFPLNRSPSRLSTGGSEKK